MTSACPDDSRLAQVLQLEEVEEELSKHLDECSQCRSRLESLFGEDPLRGAFGSSTVILDLEDDSKAELGRIESFELLREIRRGGQGVVYEARDVETGRRVALKTIHASALASEQKRARFEREITLTAGLDHPAVVTLYQSGRAADGQLYFAMEYVDGQDLAVVIREEGPAQTESVVHARLELFLEICDGIAHAHSRGVVHRDLKPSNIRIDPQGHPHILDFGLAKQIDLDMSDDLTGSIEFVGTMVWAAPEQTPWVDLPMGSWTDVYTLGHLLHWLLTEDHPYSVKGSMLKVLGRIAHGRPRLPGAQLGFYRDRSDLDAIVARALEKEPRDRYGSVGDLAEDCRCLLDGRPVAARNSGTFTLLGKMARKHPFWFTAAVVLIVVSGMVGLTLQRQVADLERMAALDELAGVRRAGRPGAFRHPGESTAWKILLSGAPRLGTEFEDAGEFPGPPGLLDTMRGIYQTMPVTSTLSLPPGTRLQGVPGGDQLAAVASDDDGRDRFLLIRLPSLQVKAHDLGLQGVFDWRLDASAQRWYFASDTGVHTLANPIPEGAAPRAAGPQATWGTLPPDLVSRASRLIPRALRAPEALEPLRALGIEDLREVGSLGTQRLFVTGADRRLRALYRDGGDWRVEELGPWQAESKRVELWDGDCQPILEGDHPRGLVEDLGYPLSMLAKQERELPRGSLARLAPDKELSAFVAGLGRGINLREGPRGAGTESKSVHGHAGKINAVLVDPYGRYFISFDMSQILRCWDAQRVLGSGLESVEGAGPGTSVRSFCQDDEWLALLGERQGVGRVDVLPIDGSTGQALELESGRFTGGAFLSDDSARMILAKDEGELLVWNWRTAAQPRVLQRLNQTKSARSDGYRWLVADPSGRKIAACSQEGVLHLLEFAKGTSKLIRDQVLDLRVPAMSQAHAAEVTPYRHLTAAAWSPSGDELVVGDEKGEITWIRHGVVEGSARLHTESVRSIAASPDGEWVACASDDYTTSLWRWGAEQEVDVLGYGHRSPVLSVAFDQESRRLASGDREGRVLIWDVATWPDGEPQFLYQINTDMKFVLALHFQRGPGAESLFLGGDEQTGALVWDPARLDRFVAGNAEYWATELSEFAKPKLLERLERWSDAKLQDPR